MWCNLFCVSVVLLSNVNSKETDEVKAKSWYEVVDRNQSVIFGKAVEADWAVKDDINNQAKKDASVQAKLERQQYREDMAKLARETFDWSNFKDTKLKRAFNKLTDVGVAAMKDKNKLKRLNQLKNKMETTYSTAKVDGKPFDPDLVQIMATSRDPQKLLHIWDGWRKVSGQQILKNWKEYAQLVNQGYKDAGSKDAGEAWKSVYEYSSTAAFESDLNRVWNQIKPLYQKLHAYTRKKLIDKYGQLANLPSKHIPAHLVGNMWSQSWEQIFDLLKPYNKSGLDVTKAMLEKNYNASVMFERSEEFFVGLGMPKMTDAFWNDSVIVKPTDREIVCYAMAEDFLNGKDFRIKMCTEVTQDDFNTVHHEMGHIEYFMLYKDQYVLFRDGANPGFHEALGDLMTLSVNTPAHLKSIGLIKDFDDDKETDINFLLKMGLSKVVFPPYAWINDMWRWKVFSGEITPENYNKEWCKYQGISNPRPNKAEYFDPAAKYHIAADVPYIRYFVSFILQFQFHQALCNMDTTQPKPPLHKCDISKIPGVGQKLKDALKLGSSEKWPVALRIITGKDTMDGQAMLEYFAPLNSWLDKEVTKESIGWDETTCPNSDISGSCGKKYDIWIILAMVIFKYLYNM